MQRITVTIDDDLLGTVDNMVLKHGYDSRSEALREMVRSFARQQQAPGSDAPCIATLSCIYDHATRNLAKRMTDTHHEHHELTVSSLHVHLDRESCLEVSILRGAMTAVQTLADSLIGQRGVRHANLHLVPIQIVPDREGHDSDDHFRKPLATDSH